MAILEGVIPAQAFEIVRNRIGEILIDEVNNQYAITYDENLNATVYIERFVPFKQTELPAINVSLFRGDLDGHTQASTDGTYTYNIDVYHAAKSTTESNGDSLAMYKLHQVIGVCRAILENSKYKTLGFAAPFIMNRHVSAITIANPAEQDAASVVMGRLTFVVKVPETSELITPELLAGYDTVVKLGLTDKGYVFSGSGFPTPAAYNADVTVNSVLYGVVEEGDTLNVVVVDTDGNLVGSNIGGVWVVPVGGGVCADATAVLKDTGGDLISTTPIPSGGSQDIVAPSATAVLKDTSGVTISTTAIKSNQSTNITAPNGAIENSNASYISTVKSNGLKILPDETHTDSDGSPVTLPALTPFTCTPQVKSLFLKALFASGDDTMETITIDADNAGTFTSESTDGSSGSITYSKNGGAFAAFSNPTTYAIGDTLVIKRTVTTAAGYAKITGTYV